MRSGTMPASPWGSTVIATTARPAPQILGFELTRSTSWLAPGSSGGIKAATGSLTYANSGQSVAKTGSPWVMPWIPRSSSELYPPVPGELVNLDLVITSQANVPAYTTRVLTGVAEASDGSITSQSSVPLIDKWESLNREVHLDSSSHASYGVGAVAQLVQQLGFMSVPPPTPGVIVYAPWQAGGDPVDAQYARLWTIAGNFGLYRTDIDGPYMAWSQYLTYDILPGANWYSWSYRPGFGFSLENTSDPSTRLTIRVSQGSNYLECDFGRYAFAARTPSGEATYSYGDMSGVKARWTVTAYASSSTQTTVKLWQDTRLVTTLVVGADVPATTPTDSSKWQVNAKMDWAKARGFQFFALPSQSGTPDIVTRSFTNNTRWYFTPPMYDDNHDVPARPALSGRANELISTLAQNMGAAVYLDEDGQFVWYDWRYLAADRTPALTLSTDANISDLQWTSTISATPRRVITSRRVPSIDESAVAWVNKDTQIAVGKTWETVIKPPDGTDWSGLYENLVIADLGYDKSFFNWVYVDGRDPSAGSVTWSMTRVSAAEGAWKISVTNPDTNATDIYLRLRGGNQSGTPSPVVRTAAVITWADTKTEGAIIGPDLARELTHDVGWTLNESETAELGQELERLAQQAYPRISNLTLFPDVRVQLCDYIQINFQIPGQTDATTAIRGYVDEIHLANSGGTLTQTLALRVTSIVSTTSYDTYQYAVGTPTYNAQQSAVGSQTYSTYQGAI